MLVSLAEEAVELVRTQRKTGGKRLYLVGAASKINDDLLGLGERAGGYTSGTANRLKLTLATDTHQQGGALGFTIGDQHAKGCLSLTGEIERR